MLRRSSGMSKISYEGIDEAALLHALYHATAAIGFGRHQDFGIPHMDHPNEMSDGSVSFDYYHGRPFKLSLDGKTKTFEGRLYDRDAPGGEGSAQRVVDKLRQTT